MKAKKSIGKSALLTLIFNFFGLLYSSVLAFFVVGGLWALGEFGLWRSTDGLAQSAGCIRQLAREDIEDLALWRDCSNDLEKITFWRDFSESVYRQDTVNGASGERTTEHLHWTTFKRAVESLIWSCIMWLIAILAGVFMTNRHNRKIAREERWLRKSNARGTVSGRSLP